VADYETILAANVIFQGLRRIEWAIFGAGCLTKLCIV
jgi:hypothetical protein